MNSKPLSASDDGPWAYTRRLPNGMLGGVFPFAIVFLGVFSSGVGIFLANDVAWDTPFWSNLVVWIGFGLMFFSVCVAIWIFFADWLWTVPQFGLALLAAIVPCAYGFVFGPLVSSVLYSHASVFAKCLLSAPIFLMHISWGRHVAQSCAAILEDKSSSDRVWVRHKGIATVFMNQCAKSVAEQKGFQVLPPLLYVGVPFLLPVPMYFFGKELTRFFSIPFIPLVFLVIGSVVFLIFTSLIVYSFIIHFRASGQIVQATGEPVLIDMVSPCVKTESTVAQ